MFFKIKHVKPKTMNNNNIFKNLVALLNYRAEHQKEKLAYTFLLDGEKEADTLTYGELDRQARAIACRLNSLNAANQHALLLYPPGLEIISAFLGCLYAQVIAIPLPPPNPAKLNRTLPRLESILSDAHPTVVLTTQKLLSAAETAFDYSPGLKSLHWVATDTQGVLNDFDENWQPEISDNDKLAYLQYTSGSTSKPRGVMISNENLIENCRYAKHLWDYTDETISVHWMPYFHDYGLVDGIIMPLFNGTPCYLMSPLDFLKHPIKWLAAISKYKATHSAGPNFSYELCLRRSSDEQCADLDLSSWSMAANAAEPIKKETLELFTKKFEKYGFRWNSFYPSYGLAEATLVVSARKEPRFVYVHPTEYEKHKIKIEEDNKEKVKAVVGCGRIALDMEVEIVNPETCLICPPDEVGEIWVKHPCVAKGYWQRSEETNYTFQAHIADSNYGPFLRTGDLGFFHDNELCVTGRYKDLIIINGRNYYPQDIELIIEKSHVAIRSGCCAAFSLEIAGKETIVAVVEIERRYEEEKTTNSEIKNSFATFRQENVEIDAFSNKLDKPVNFMEIVEAIRTSVAEEYNLQIYGIILIKAGKIFKTSSGKLQRHACRRGFLQRDMDEIFRWSLEEDLQTFDTKTVISTSIVDKPLENTDKTRSKETTNTIIDWLRAYSTERINSQLIDERRCIPPYIVLDFGNRGILGMQVPKEYGGIALNHSDSMRLLEQLAAIDLSLATFCVINNFLGIAPIQHFAPKALREQLLPNLANGRELAAFALTEPGAGSNPAAILSTGILTSAGSWLLNGVKIWSGSASWANIINVFVKTEENFNNGVTAFAVKQGTPGLKMGQESLTMGMRGLVQNSVVLENLLLGNNFLLGEVGNGMVVANQAMLYTRFCLGVLSLGGLKRCAQLMLRYAANRSISTGILLDNPVTLARLGELTASITSLEIFLSRLSNLLDKGQPVPMEAFIVCKTSGPEFLGRAADHLIQLLGGRGYIETNIAPQIMRDARIFRIFEGPTETLNMFLGATVLNKGQKVEDFISNDIGSVKVSNRLRLAVEKLYNKCFNLTKLDKPSALRWAHIAIGELTTIAFLWAAVEVEFYNNPSEKVQRALDWLRTSFEENLELALKNNAREQAITNKSTIRNLIYDYQQSIGDLEQTLAGEDYQLDDLLKLTSNKISKNFLHPSNSDGLKKPSSLKTSNKLFTEHSKNLLNINQIKSWILEWISKKTKIETYNIDSSKPFVYYGLDSVTGVMISQDLEDFIGQPLPTTLVWDYPSIDSLIEFLVGRKTPLELNKKKLSFDAHQLDIELLAKELEEISDGEAQKRLSKNKKIGVTEVSNE